MEAVEYRHGSTPLTGWLARPESALRGRTSAAIVQEILDGAPLDIGQL